MTGWIGVVINAPKAQSLAYFYRDLLGWPLADDEADWCTMGSPAPHRSLNPMSDYVKPTRRTYRSPTRTARAAATRRRILDAAARRFLEDGYRQSTVELIAADARVSAKTVYHLFGSKIGLVKSVLDVAFVADDGAQEGSSAR